MSNDTCETVIPLHELAQELGISRRWLHHEAVANRIPSLKAGQRRLYNLDAVRRVLAVRAAGSSGEEMEEVPRDD